MFKHIILGLVAASALVSSAFAADLPNPKKDPLLTPLSAPAPRFALPELPKLGISPISFEQAYVLGSIDGSFTNGNSFAGQSFNSRAIGLDSGFGYHFANDMRLEGRARYNWNTSGNGMSFQSGGGNIQTCGACGGMKIGSYAFNTTASFGNAFELEGRIYSMSLFKRDWFNGVRLFALGGVKFGNSQTASIDESFKLNQKLFKGVTIPNQHVADYSGRTDACGFIGGGVSYDVTRNVEIAGSVQKNLGCSSSIYATQKGLPALQSAVGDVTFKIGATVRFGGNSAPVVARY